MAFRIKSNCGSKLNYSLIQSGVRELNYSLMQSVVRELNYSLMQSGVRELNYSLMQSVSGSSTTVSCRAVSRFMTGSSTSPN